MLGYVTTPNETPSKPDTVIDHFGSEEQLYREAFCNALKFEPSLMIGGLLYREPNLLNTPKIVLDLFHRHFRNLESWRCKLILQDVFEQFTVFTGIVKTIWKTEDEKMERLFCLFYPDGSVEDACFWPIVLLFRCRKSECPVSSSEFGEELLRKVIQGTAELIIRKMNFPDSEFLK